MPAADAEPVVASARKSSEHAVSGKVAPHPAPARWGPQPGTSTSLRFGYKQFKPPGSQMSSNNSEEAESKAQGKKRVIFRNTLTSDFGGDEVPAASINDAPQQDRRSFSPTISGQIKSASPPLQIKQQAQSESPSPQVVMSQVKLPSGTPPRDTSPSTSVSQDVASSLPIPHGAIPPLHHAQFPPAQKPLAASQPFPLPSSLSVPVPLPNSHASAGIPYTPSPAWYPVGPPPSSEQNKSAQSPPSGNAPLQPAQLQQWQHQLMQSFLPDVNALLQFQRALIVQQLIQTGLTLEQIQLLTSPSMMNAFSPYSLGGNLPQSSQINPLLGQMTAQPSSQTGQGPLINLPQSLPQFQNQNHMQTPTESLATDRPSKAPQNTGLDKTPQASLQSLPQSQKPNQVQAPTESLATTDPPVKASQNTGLNQTSRGSPQNSSQSQIQNQVQTPTESLATDQPSKASQNFGLEKTSQASPEVVPATAHTPLPQDLAPQDPNQIREELARRLNPKKKYKTRKQKGMIFLNYSSPGLPLVRSETDPVEANNKGRNTGLRADLSDNPQIGRFASELRPQIPDEKMKISSEAQPANNISQVKAQSSAGPSEITEFAPIAIPVSLQRSNQQIHEDVVGPVKQQPSTSSIDEEPGKNDVGGQPSTLPKRKPTRQLSAAHASAIVPVFTVRANKSRTRGIPNLPNTSDEPSIKSESVQDDIAPGALSGMTSRLRADTSIRVNEPKGSRFGKFSAKTGDEKKKNYKFSNLDARHYSTDSSVESLPSSRRASTKSDINADARPDTLSKSRKREAAVTESSGDELEESEVDDVLPSKKLRSQRRAAAAASSSTSTPLPKTARAIRASRLRASQIQSKSALHPLIPPGAPPPVMPLFPASDDEKEEEAADDSESNSSESSSTEESDYSSTDEPKVKAAGRRQNRRKR